jgi:hypothetical protein
VFVDDVEAHVFVATVVEDAHVQHPAAIAQSDLALGDDVLEKAIVGLVDQGVGLGLGACLVVDSRDSTSAAAVRATLVVVAHHVVEHDLEFVERLSRA